jgi:hypothetical protein
MSVPRSKSKPVAAQGDVDRAAAVQPQSVTTLQALATCQKCHD